MLTTGNVLMMIRGNFAVGISEWVKRDDRGSWATTFLRSQDRALLHQLSHLPEPVLEHTVFIYFLLRVTAEQLFC